VAARVEQHSFASTGQLTRSYVVVPTRGQALGLKQRCLEAGVPLLGVEFLTPGLARKKWLLLHQRENPAENRPSAGREILLMGLEALVHERIASLTPNDPAWGFWKSFQSDLDRALDDFDDLLKAGFTAADFGIPALREVFTELAAWVAELGYALSPVQSEGAGLKPLSGDSSPIGGRLLVYGLSAELWSEFFNVAALARRFREVTVLLPEPEFGGRKTSDERWTELWQALLGVSAVPLDLPEPSRSCAAVGELLVSHVDLAQLRTVVPDQCRVIVGKTRRDEMLLVAGEIEQAIKGGARHIGVVFPAAGTLHASLARLLQERGIPFTSALETAAPPALDFVLHRELVGFYLRGGRLEDLLRLWPLLRSSGIVKAELGSVRALCERLFDERQSHALAVYLERLSSLQRPEAKEVCAIATRLLPGFGSEVTIKAAVERFVGVCEALGISRPVSLGTLESLAARDQRILPAPVVLRAILAFLPDRQAAQELAASSFARVTLTTRRRADGMVFSHLFFVQANAGVWPRRAEPSPWLTDEYKATLNQRSKYSLGLYTADDRLELERQSYLRLCRDAECEIVFSAALYDERDPESRLGPNSWLERVLWCDPELRSARCSIEELYSRMADSAEREKAGKPFGIDAAVAAWRSRRDANHPFDAWFATVDPVLVRPRSLPARLLERGAVDPAELWFGGVLELQPVDWRPFARARKRSIGQWTHRVLAAALRPEQHDRGFGPRIDLQTARLRLEARLALLRNGWPEDRYWESFYLELRRVAHELLESLYALPLPEWTAAELPLAENATVAIGAGESLHVRGRIDFVAADRPSWTDATVQIVDFKTGADAGLSVDRMSRDGFALQLGIYLAAAKSMGAVGGQVWMLKPQAGGTTCLGMEELPQALQLLKLVGAHLRSGVYGSLTAPKSEYEPEGLRWPVACVPIPPEALQAKYRMFLREHGEVEW
jgi:hypothetical protein